MVRQRKSGKTKQEVLSMLREQILYLGYLPGAVLQDTEIAEQFMVSRTPVREALLVLQQEQLVEIYPQSGTFVARLDVELIREAAYMRHVLEWEMWELLLAQKAPLRKWVHRCLVMQELAVNEKDQKEYVKNDHLFHETVFALAGHQKSWEMLKPQYNHTTRFHMLDFYDPELLGTSLEEHQEILDIYEQGDREKLRQLIDEHHDCTLRTASKLKEVFPEYFK